MARFKDLKVEKKAEGKIFHPLKKKRTYSKRDIANLRKWALIEDSVGDSVWDSVRYSVGNSIEDSVGNSVWYSIRNSVWDSVGNSVWDSVEDSVGTSVGTSVWDSVYGYISSFVNLDKWKCIEHEKGVNPYQCCIDLWERSLVPSFDGNIWRLHSGVKADIVFEITKSALIYN